MRDNTLYISHIDHIRKKHKLTIKALCNNICDERTYRRYKTGERTISQDMINSFCERLGLSQDEFYNSYHRSDLLDYNKIGNLYVLITTKEMNKAFQELKRLNNIPLKTTESKRFLKLCNIMYEIYSINPSYPQILNDLNLLINYPDCLQKDQFTFVEIAAINQIVFIQAYINKNYKDALILHDLLNNKKIFNITTNTRYYMGSIYHILSQVFGMQGDLDKSLHISKEGINYSLRSKDTRVLHNLYYFASLCCYKMNRYDEAYHYAEKSIATCIAMDDQQNLTKLNNLYQKEQGYKIEIRKN